MTGISIIAGNWYLGYEHPLADNKINGVGAWGELARELPFRPGAPVAASAVVGVARAGQLRRDFLELHQTLRVGNFVYSINRRASRLLEMRCHRLIRGQHKLFDDSMCDVARAARYAGHLAEFIELDERLRHVEIDGPATDPLLVQHQSEFAHQLEARN